MSVILLVSAVNLMHYNLTHLHENTWEMKQKYYHLFTIISPISFMSHVGSVTLWCSIWGKSFLKWYTNQNVFPTVGSLGKVPRDLQQSWVCKRIAEELHGIGPRRESWVTVVVIACWMWCYNSFVKFYKYDMNLYQHLVAKHQETLYSYLVLSVFKSKFFIKSLQISWLSLTVVTDVIQDL